MQPPSCMSGVLFIAYHIISKGRFGYLTRNVSRHFTMSPCSSVRRMLTSQALVSADRFG
jgi:hypothetical protein